MENLSRNFSEIFIFRVVKQTVLLENSSIGIFSSKTACVTPQNSPIDHWMSFPVKRSQKFPRNLPIRVKNTFLSQNEVQIDDSDKQKFDDDTNQKKMVLVHEKVKARRPQDFPGMDFQEACLAKHRFVGKSIKAFGPENTNLLK